MTNEKLIEEAYRQGRSDEKYSLAYAPPVFEKAHTPTDDEREAISDEAIWDFADDLLNSWNIEDQNPPSLAEDFRDRFVARFRRAEVPEPSAPMSLADDPMRAPFQKKSPEPQGPKYVEVGHPSGERQPVEPQGEPSDASDCEYCGGEAWHHTVECFTGTSAAQEAVARLENCLANREAGIGAWSMVRPEDVRTVLAALRAAREVRS